MLVEPATTSRLSASWSSSSGKPSIAAYGAVTASPTSMISAITPEEVRVLAARE